MANKAIFSDHPLTIPRMVDMEPGVAFMGQRVGEHLMPLYGSDGRLVVIFDNRLSVDLYVEPGDDGQPVTEEEISRARIVSVEDENSETVVYFIGGDTGCIKIGRTINLESRFKAIQSCSPIPLRVLATRKGDELEKQYHRHFAKHRAHGEWFERHPDILAEIERLSAPAPAIEMM